MIFNSLGGFAAASFFGLFLAAAGCESNGGHAKGPHTMPDGTTMAGTSHAMMCPKCETVWTFQTVDQGMKSQRLTTKSGMVCPTCDKMAESYVKDGQKTLHNCPDCKVTPVVMTPAPVTHIKGSHP